MFSLSKQPQAIGNYWPKQLDAKNVHPNGRMLSKEQIEKIYSQPLPVENQLVFNDEYGCYLINITGEIYVVADLIAENTNTEDKIFLLAALLADNYKVLKQFHVKKNSELNEVRNEHALLKKLGKTTSPIISPSGSEYHFIISDYEAGDEIHQLIRYRSMANRSESTWPDLMWINICVKIVDAGLWLEANNILHLDVWGRNIIYDPLQEKATLIDFGRAAETTRATEEKLEPITLTHFYHVANAIPPEHTLQQGKKGDMYQYTSEMTTFTFGKILRSVALGRSSSGDLKTNQALQELFKKMEAQNPVDRKSLKEARKELASILTNHQTSHPDEIEKMQRCQKAIHEKEQERLKKFTEQIKKHELSAYKAADSFQKIMALLKPLDNPATYIVGRIIPNEKIAALAATLIEFDKEHKDPTSTSYKQVIEAVKSVCGRLQKNKQFAEIIALANLNQKLKIIENEPLQAHCLALTKSNKIEEAINLACEISERRHIASNLNDIMNQILAANDNNTVEKIIKVFNVFAKNYSNFSDTDTAYFPTDTLCQYYNNLIEADRFSDADKLLFAIDQHSFLPDSHYYSVRNKFTQAKIKYTFKKVMNLLNTLENPTGCAIEEKNGNETSGVLTVAYAEFTRECKDITANEYITVVSKSCAIQAHLSLNHASSTAERMRFLGDATDPVFLLQRAKEHQKNNKLELALANVTLSLSLADLNSSFDENAAKLTRISIYFALKENPESITQDAPDLLSHSTDAANKLLLVKAHCWALTKLDKIEEAIHFAYKSSERTHIVSNLNDVRNQILAENDNNTVEKAIRMFNVLAKNYSDLSFTYPLLKYCERLIDANRFDDAGKLLVAIGWYSFPPDSHYYSVRNKLSQAKIKYTFKKVMDLLETLENPTSCAVEEKNGYETAGTLTAAYAEFTRECKDITSHQYKKIVSKSCSVHAAYSSRDNESGAAKRMRLLGDATDPVFLLERAQKYYENDELKLALADVTLSLNSAGLNSLFDANAAKLMRVNICFALKENPEIITQDVSGLLNRSTGAARKFKPQLVEKHCWALTKLNKIEEAIHFAHKRSKRAHIACNLKDIMKQILAENDSNTVEKAITALNALAKIYSNFSVEDPVSFLVSPLLTYCTDLIKAERFDDADKLLDAIGKHYFLNSNYHLVRNQLTYEKSCKEVMRQWNALKQPINHVMNKKERSSLETMAQKVSTLLDRYRGDYNAQLIQVGCWVLTRLDLIEKAINFALIEDALCITQHLAAIFEQILTENHRDANENALFVFKIFQGQRHRSWLENQLARIFEVLGSICLDNGLSEKKLDLLLGVFHLLSDKDKETSEYADIYTRRINSAFYDYLSSKITALLDQFSQLEEIDQAEESAILTQDHGEAKISYENISTSIALEQALEQAVEQSLQDISELIKKISPILHLNWDRLPDCQLQKLRMRLHGTEHPLAKSLVAMIPTFNLMETSKDAMQFKDSQHIMFFYHEQAGKSKHELTTSSTAAPVYSPQ